MSDWGTLALTVTLIVLFLYCVFSEGRVRGWEQRNDKDGHP